MRRSGIASVSTTLLSVRRVAIVYAYLYDQLSFMRQGSFFQTQTRE